MKDRVSITMLEDGIADVRMIRTDGRIFGVDGQRARLADEIQ